MNECSKGCSSNKRREKMREKVGILSTLPATSLMALGEDPSGKLKDSLVLLAQLTEAYAELLTDSAALNKEPENEEQAEWQGRAEALLIHAEYVLGGKARLPTNEKALRDNVTVIESRLHNAVDEVSDSELKILSKPCQVISLGGMVLQ